MWEGARGVWEGCEKDVVGVRKGSWRGAGGLQEVGVREVCRRSAGGVWEGCGRFGLRLTKIFH